MAGDDGRCRVAVAVVLRAGRQNNQRLCKIRAVFCSFSAPSTALISRASTIAAPFWWQISKGGESSMPNEHEKDISIKATSQSNRGIEEINPRENPQNGTQENPEKPAEGGRGNRQQGESKHTGRRDIGVSQWRGDRPALRAAAPTQCGLSATCGWWYVVRPRDRTNFPNTTAEDRGGLRTTRENNKWMG